MVKFTGLVKPEVTKLPNESSTATTGWAGKTADGLGSATPVGWVVKTSWVGAPKLETWNVWLVAGFAGTAPLPFAVMV